MESMDLEVEGEDQFFACGFAYLNSRIILSATADAGDLVSELDNIIRVTSLPLLFLLFCLP